jgi:hypothetical protein
MRRVITIAPLGAALAAGGAPLSAQSKDQPSRQTCDQLVEGSRMTDEGRCAFQEFLPSGRAPELLDRLLHLAEGTGNGGPIAGLERLSEVMEKTGGLLGVPTQQ